MFARVSDIKESRCDESGEKKNGTWRCDFEAPEKATADNE
jgi:hypothetical protein